VFDPFKNKDKKEFNYELILESKNEKGQTAKFEGKFPINQFYDEYGYLHRYVVRDVLE
jgi:hypothetical protein